MNLKLQRRRRQVGDKAKAVSLLKCASISLGEGLDLLRICDVFLYALD